MRRKPFNAEAPRSGVNGGGTLDGEPAAAAGRWVAHRGLILGVLKPRIDAAIWSRTPNLLVPRPVLLWRRVTRSMRMPVWMESDSRDRRPISTRDHSSGI